MPRGDDASPLTRHEDVRQVLSDVRFSRLLDAEDTTGIADSASGGVFNSDLATRSLSAARNTSGGAGW